MSYPYSVTRFGLPIDPAQEAALGPIEDRNLQELFVGSAELTVPDQIVGAIFSNGRRPPSGLYPDDFGLHEVGYTEYMVCNYTFGLRGFKVPGMGFEPDEIQTVNPADFLVEAQASVKNAQAAWDALLAKVNPTPLLWLYVSPAGVALPPQILQLTLSN